MPKHDCKHDYYKEHGGRFFELSSGKELKLIRIDEIAELHTEIIDDLVKCKCGIPSHEYKVKKLIDKWIKKRVNL